MNTAIFVIVGIIGFSGQITAVIISAFLNQRSANRAQENATKAQLATIKASEDAYKAQESAAEAARQLVISAKSTDEKLNELQEVTNTTHKIVNNQRTIMLRLVASLSRRIADENPSDEAAQKAASEAEKDVAN